MKAAATTDDRPTGTVELEMSLPGEGQSTMHVDSNGICGSDLHSLESLASGQASAMSLPARSPSSVRRARFSRLAIEPHRRHAYENGEISKG